MARFVINVFQQGTLNESVEIDGCEAAWDRYQFYRMACPKAKVVMMDSNTGEFIAGNE